ncbi:MAG TPA: dipeptidase [Gemmatimonadaceae bacterium]|nr:dipeptidase [Gemmatimonadaceae bacterium]
MRCLLALLALTTISVQMPAQPTERDMARAKRVLASTPLVDGHNDLAWAIRESTTAPRDVAAYDLRKRTTGHTDLARLREGMVGAQFWSVYIPGEVRDSGYARVQMEQIDIARRFIEMYPERLQWALTAKEIRAAFRRKKIGSLLGLEGGHAIENSLGTLRTYYDLGARYMTLTHNVTLDWADAAADSARHGGLTAFGKEVVREMNRLGMLVDLSHVSPATMSDALDVSEAPVIFSHSNARALVDVPRNIPDSILKRLPANGGVAMVTFVTSFISSGAADWERHENRALAPLRQQFGADTAAFRTAADAWRAQNPRPAVTIREVANHIEHIRKVAGIDHIGIGGDFDGISITIQGLEDVSKYPALFAELAHRGWSDGDMKKLAGENILRALTKAEEVSTRLRKARPASTRTIGELDRAAVSR